MPEGDTIYRTAVTLRKAILGATILRFETSLPEVAAVDSAGKVAGRTVVQIEPLGKNLLMVFRAGDGDAGGQVGMPPRLQLDLRETDLVLHSHLRMTGSWHIYRPEEAWRKPRRYMKAALFTGDFAIPCFSAPLVKLLTARQASRDDYLAGLGPDAMTDGFDDVRAVELLASRPSAEIGVAIMNQRLMAGVGNVYKSEVLFINRVNPFAKVSDLSADALRGLVAESHRLLVANRANGDRRTVFRLDANQRLWVYGRGGSPCRICGEPICMRRQGLEGRATYYCPRCQQVGH